VPAFNAPTTAGSAVQWAKRTLTPSTTASLDAALLLGHVLGRDRSWILAHGDEPLSAEAEARYRELVDRRATGVPVAWAELYTALQTGVVDGAENNHPSVVAKKFYEVSKYYTLDEHMRIPDLLVVSMKFYDSLNAQQKAAVMQAGALTQAYMRGAWKISENKDLADLKAKFTQIIEPNKQPFMDAVKPLVLSEAKRLDVEKTVNFILDSGKKF